MSVLTALLTVTVLLSGARVEDVPNPRAAQSWVSDTAHVLDGAAVRKPKQDSPSPPVPALGAAALHDPVPFQARLRAPHRTGRPSHTTGFGLAFVIFLGVFFIILAAVVTFLIKGGRKVRRWASEQATGQDGSSSDGFFQTSASSVMDDQPSRLHTTPDTATTHMTSNTESLASSSFASDSLSSASSATSFSDNSSSSPADSMSSGSSSSSADTTSSSSDFGGGSSGGGGSGSDW